MDLLTQYRLGGLTLKNRLVMSAMTRNRAGDGNVPGPLALTYYTQRASAGLIVTEGSQVSPQGVGYARTPGIHSDAQVGGWRAITDAVHDAGGAIFLQLWHVGRISHPEFHGGELPVGPSAIAPAGTSYTPSGPQPMVAPRALDLSEIAGVVDQFRTWRSAREGRGLRRRRASRRERLSAGSVPADGRESSHRCLRRQRREPRAPPARGHGSRHRHLGRRPRRLQSVTAQQL